MTCEHIKESFSDLYWLLIIPMGIIGVMTLYKLDAILALLREKSGKEKGSNG